MRYRILQHPYPTIGKFGLNETTACQSRTFYTEVCVLEVISESLIMSPTRDSGIG